MRSKRLLIGIGLFLVLLLLCWPGHKEFETKPQLPEPTIQAAPDDEVKLEVPQIHLVEPTEKILKHRGLKMRFVISEFYPNGVIKELKRTLVNQNNEPVTLIDPDGIIDAAIRSEATVFETNYRWKRCQQITDPTKRPAEVDRIVNTVASYVIIGELSPTGFQQLDPKLQELVRQKLGRQKPSKPKSPNPGGATTARLMPWRSFFNSVNSHLPSLHRFINLCYNINI